MVIGARTAATALTVAGLIPRQLPGLRRSLANAHGAAVGARPQWSGGDGAARESRGASTLAAPGGVQ